MIFPIRPCFGALSELALAVLAERVHTDRWERDRARRVVGLRRDEAQRPADPLEGLNDLQLRPVQINILPAQSKQLPATQAKEQREDVERV